MVARARAAGARAADFELLTRVLATLAGATSAGALTVQLLKWNDFARAPARFDARYDLLLTLTHPPIRHGQGDPRVIVKGVTGQHEAEGWPSTGLNPGATNQDVSAVSTQCDWKRKRCALKIKTSRRCEIRASIASLNNCRHKSNSANI